MYPTLVHPKSYVWDFWYYYDPQKHQFHVFYLNADPALVPSGKHHDAARVGYGVTADFISMEWGQSDVLVADRDKWYNISIWTGDVISIQNGYLLFFTSRNSRKDDGRTQNIGIAFSERIDTQEWTPIEGIRIEPDWKYYHPHHVKGDVTTHAWRDPFLFRYRNHNYMLVAAKSVDRPVERNGTIALLKSESGDLLSWNVLSPIVNLGFYSEMEVPQLYFDEGDQLSIVYSCSSLWDFAPTSDKAGGLHTLSSIDLLGFISTTPQVLLPESSGLYACRIIPEMGGEIVGFDVKTGGIRRSGIKTSYRHLDRDFSDFKYTSIKK